MKAQVKATRSDKVDFGPTIQKMRPKGDFEILKSAIPHRPKKKNTTTKQKKTKNHPANLIEQELKTMNGKVETR